jgi:hypothetical protein
LRIRPWYGSPSPQNRAAIDSAKQFLHPSDTLEHPLVVFHVASHQEIEVLSDMIASVGSLVVAADELSWSSRRVELEKRFPASALTEHLWVRLVWHTTTVGFSVPQKVMRKRRAHF